MTYFKNQLYKPFNYYLYLRHGVTIIWKTRTIKKHREFMRLNFTLNFYMVRYVHHTELCNLNCGVSEEKMKNESEI